MEHFRQNEGFTLLWWGSVAAIIILMIVWWILTDKKRLLEICIFGFFVNMAAVFLDVMGEQYVLWDYYVHIFPQIPLMIPVDYVGVPIVGMLIYQRYHKWGSFLLASAIAAAVMSFVLEPLAVRIGLYILIKWKYIYSFPIYILIYIVAKFSTMQLFKIDRIAKSKA